MDSDDSAEWLESSAILVIKSFAFLAKQGHIAASKSPEGSTVLRDACEEVRRLVNSCVRHDRVRDPSRVQCELSVFLENNTAAVV